MSIISTTTEIWKLNRDMTLRTVDAITEMDEPGQVLGWRPGTGRAHIAWQLMHIGITEELFATERLLGTTSKLADLAPRFKGGSTPDDDIPTVEMIRDVLDTGRENFLQTIAGFSDADLETIPEPFKERGWSLGTILKIVSWHECHHQGQAHLTLNLYKAAHG